MKYTASDIKQWITVFLEEDNFFMAHEAINILLYTPVGEDIPNDLVVHTVYAEYLKIMNRRPRSTVCDDHLESLNIMVRIKNNTIVSAFVVGDENEE